MEQRKFIEKENSATSASEVYWPNVRRLWAKLVPSFADKGFRVVSATDPHSR
jgi:hypothetical protein